jgi:hypothetical protein
MSEENTLAEALAEEFDKQTAEETSEEAVVEETVSEDVVEASDEETAEVKPPEHWSEEDQKVFMEMDERGREFALSQETNFSKGIEEKSKELKQFRDAFEPYKHLFPEGSESQVIQQLLNAQSTLQQDPVEGIKWLMKSYGVDEKQFTPTETPDDVYIDPDVKALKDEIAELKRNSEQNARTTENRRQQMMLAEVQKVRDEVDDDGNLLRPHFNNVQGVMAGLMQSGRADSMESAYEQAVWAVPEYRDSEVDRIAKEKSDKALADKKAEAEKAESAAKSVEGKSSSKSSPKDKTLSDSLSENFDKSVRGEL